MTDAADNQQIRIDTEAAEWVIRQGGDKFTSQDQQSFKAWMAASPLHQQAFQRASALWSGFDAGGRKKQVKARRAAGYVATTGLAGLGIFALSFHLGWFEPSSWLADYTTGSGQIRTIHLTDGSIAELDSRAALNIRYTDGERRVVLVKGEAYFTVAPVAGEERRPFIVEAASGTSTALGTQFMVARDGDDVDTTVTEHKVRVTVNKQSSLTQSLIVAEGQRVHYGPGGLTDTYNAELSKLTAWRHGQVVFDNEPLVNVINRLNHYSHGRIMVFKPGVMQRRVSGVFACADVDNALITISQELHLKVVSVGRLVTLLY